MSRGDRLVAGLRARILASSHRLTVVAPPAGPVVVLPTTTTTAPSVNPLLGGASTTIPTVTEADPAPTTPNVTVACLWYDAMQLSDLRTSSQAARLSAMGWRQDADALAQVLAEDAVVSGAPGTRFDTADVVLHGDRHYAVIGVTPLGPGFGPPHSYYVWLRSQTGQ